MRTLRFFRLSCPLLYRVNLFYCANSHLPLPFLPVFGSHCSAMLGATSRLKEVPEKRTLRFSVFLPIFLLLTRASPLLKLHWCAVVMSSFMHGTRSLLKNGRFASPFFCPFFCRLRRLSFATAPLVRCSCDLVHAWD